MIFLKTTNVIFGIIKTILLRLLFLVWGLLFITNRDGPGFFHVSTTDVVNCLPLAGAHLQNNQIASVNDFHSSPMTNIDHRSVTALLAVRTEPSVHRRSVSYSNPTLLFSTMSIVSVPLLALSSFLVATFRELAKYTNLSLPPPELHTKKYKSS